MWILESTAQIFYGHSDEKHFWKLCSYHNLWLRNVFFKNIVHHLSNKHPMCNVWGGMRKYSVVRQTDGRITIGRPSHVHWGYCYKNYISLLTLMVSQSKQQRKSQFMLMSSFSKISFIKDVFTNNIYIFCHRYAWKHEFFRIKLQSQTEIPINLLVLSTYYQKRT